MPFGIQKRKVLVVKGDKQVVSDGLELSSGDVIYDVDKNGCNYFGALQAKNVKRREMRSKVNNENLILLQF